MSLFCGLLVVCAASLSGVAAQTPSTRRSRVIPVDIAPSSQPKAGMRHGAALRAERPSALDLDRWRYRVERVNARDGVPWRLIATPLSDLAETLTPGTQFDLPARVLDIPVVRIPEQLWPQWFDPDLQDVVGIHFHEFHANAEADILLTVHKVPADGPDGRPAADYNGRPGTRLEATLLKPLTYNLDQSIAVRVDGRQRRNPKSAEHRTEHERGHAELSLHTLLGTLAGPQTWDAKACTGHRSTLTWYWDNRLIARAWDGYHGGSGTLATLRTSITLVPPTRWSVLIPLPPDEVSQRQIQAFNDSIVHLGEQYKLLDATNQARFHATHGDFEVAKP